MTLDELTRLNLVLLPGRHSQNVKYCCLKFKKNACCAGLCDLVRDAFFEEQPNPQG